MSEEKKLPDEEKSKVPTADEEPKAEKKPPEELFEKQLDKIYAT